jgi:Nif-specific regulatory protein
MDLRARRIARRQGPNSGARSMIDADALRESYKTVGSAAEAMETGRNDRELATLMELSQVVSETTGLTEVVHKLADRLGMAYATLTLRDPASGEFVIEEAHGLPRGSVARTRYRAGEGVIGQVIETGTPMIVPSVAAEPRFLHRALDRSRLQQHDFSYICVPIKVGDTVVGTLSAERQQPADVTVEQDARVLMILSSMIGLAVRTRQQGLEEQRELAEENRRLQSLTGRRRPANIVGSDDKRMREVYDQIAQVAPADATVLVRGESGTGKELVANAIHEASSRASGPFIKVNCAALPESILESELFGHERGAFTGAVAARKGRFELAHGGTIFLDEVGDFTPATQVKLLRVIQEREFERLGGTRTVATDIRVLAATNRDLEALVRAGLFREDLYYRLNVFEITMPPLRERRSDILLLANHFVERYSAKSGKNVRRISTPAIDMLMAYHWPGNVRELENCIERAVLLTSDDVIRAHHLPPTLQTADASGTTHHGTLESALVSLERELLVDALKNHRGNRAAAARALGLTERVMGLRVARHGLDPRRFRT